MDEDYRIDRRIVRTQLAIREALISLVQEKSFDALSVKDITTRANINRGTFYLHFRDKYDLLDKIEAGIIQDLQQIIRQASRLDVADFKNLQQPLPVMVQFFEYLQKNAPIIHAVLALKDDATFRSRVIKAIEINMFEMGFFASMKEADLLVPRKYLVNYIVSAHLGVIQLWLQRGCIETPEEMAMILTKLSFQGVYHAIGGSA